ATAAIGRPGRMETPGTAEPVTARAADTGAGLWMKPLRVGGESPVSAWLMVAYDDLFSIQYNRENLRPYWRKDGWEAKDLLLASAKERGTLMDRCAAFDRELMDDLAGIG